MNGPLDGVTLYHARFQAASDLLQTAIDIVPPGKGGVIPLSGPPRCGKSALVTELVSKLARDVRGCGALWTAADVVSASVPAQPSAKDLYEAIVRALGQRPRRTERAQDLRDRACQIIADQATRILFLDEANHLAELGAKFSRRAAADHLKAFVDRTGIVLVLSGLPKTERIIRENEQLRDRAFRTVELHPYQWVVENDRVQFMEAILTLFDAMSEAGFELAGDERDLARRLYGASGGRIGRVIHLLNAAAKLRTNRGSLELEHLARAERTIVIRSENLPEMLGPEVPTDGDLDRAYATVMQGAELPVRGGHIDNLRGLR